MSPKQSKGKVVAFGMRRPDPAVAEDAIRALESKAEALGNGVAGQAEAVTPVVALPAAGRGVVQRKGRLRADGTRTEARALHRVTVYLPPEIMKALELQALETGQNKSVVIQTALAEHLDV